jgi:integrase
MPIYERVYGNKRGVWWFNFFWNGRHIQRSTGIKVGPRKNIQAAKDAEANYRALLAKGEAGILERPAAPILKEFSQRFVDAIESRCAAKPRTVEFYSQQLKRLLEFEPLASAQLDAIDESLIEQFVQYRRQQVSRAGGNRKKRQKHIAAKPVSPASVNRALATLRRLLRLAHEWQIINRVPRIRLLPGEHNREFILSHAQEVLYLEMASQPLKDIAALVLDTGLRLGEALALEWPEIHLEPAAGARFGYLHVRDGKSRFARRNVPLTERARAMLDTRKAESQGEMVFSEDGTRPMRISSLDHLHRTMRQTLKMPSVFVLHSLRHTYGTRLGEAGADAFTIMRLMGHSSVTVSQRYVHPTPEALERAVERLEGLNQSAMARLQASQKRILPTTVSTTVKSQ